MLFADFPGKDIGVGCYSRLQGIFLTQGLNPHLLSLLYWQADSSSLCHLAFPRGGGACSLSVLRDPPRRAPVEIQLPPESGPDRDGAGAGFVGQAGVSPLCFPGLFTPGSQTAVQGLISVFIKHLPSGYCSVTQSCPTLCHPAGCGIPGFPVLHCLLEFAQPSHALLPPSPALSLSQPQGLPMSWIFVSSGQSIGALPSASVLPMNIQDGFSLGLTDLISLLFKGLLRVL